MAWPPLTHGDVKNEITIFRDRAIPRHGIVAGLYYSSPGAMTGSNVTTTLDRLTYHPVWVPTGTVNELAVRVTGVASAGSGGVVRVGMYSANANMHPSTLLVDASTASTETLGVKAFTVSIGTTSGIYYLAAVSQVATASLTATAPADSTFGVGQLTPGDGSAHGFLSTGISAALPATPTVSVAGVALIRVWYRMAA